MGGHPTPEMRYVYLYANDNGESDCCAFLHFDTHPTQQHLLSGDDDGYRRLNSDEPMDFVISFLTQYGYWGMMLAAFLAGSFFPFSSEAVMVALMATGLNPWTLMIYGTIGNVLGSVFNYGVGRMGKIEWIEKYLHVKKQDLDKAHRFLAGRGAWMGFFAFLPVLGSAITIALGLMRSNVVITFIAITIGKLFRYIILIYGAGLFI